MKLIVYNKLFKASLSEGVRVGLYTSPCFRFLGPQRFSHLHHPSSIMQTIISFCTFEGYFTLIHTTHTQKKNEYVIQLLQVGLFEGIRKSASLELRSDENISETDALLHYLRESSTCRRIMDSAVGTFVRVNFHGLNNIVNKTLEGNALKKWRRTFEKFEKDSTLSPEIISDEEKDIPKDWTDDSAEANDKVTEGFESLCNSHEQFGDLRLKSWRFSREQITRYVSFNNSTDETCRCIIEQDESICVRLRSLLTFMKLYFNSRNEHEVVALLEAMKRKCTATFCGGALLRSVVRRSINFITVRPNTPTKSMSQKRCIPGPRHQRFIRDYLRLTYLYIVPARNALEATSMRGEEVRFVRAMVFILFLVFVISYTHTHTHTYLHSPHWLSLSVFNREISRTRFKY